MKKVPGAIDCLSDVFVLGFWRVLLDFYPAVWEERLRLPVSGCAQVPTVTGKKLWRQGMDSELPFLRRGLA
jgi:hypothetical protein